MVNLQTSSKKQKHKQVKRKERFSSHIYLGTPQVPLRNKQRQQQHELLSDWKNSS